MTGGRTCGFLLLMIFAVTGFPAFAQEEGDEEPGGSIPIESDWAAFNPGTYARGDQTFNVALGPVFPVGFFGANGKMDAKIKIGGAGSLSYNYFLTPNIFVGGEIGGMFAQTKAKNMYFIIPMGARVGYQFVFRSFEFPLAVMLGGAPQKYLDWSYFGYFMKVSAGAYWRFNSDWSFGLNTAWWWVPQWTSKKNENVHGHFIELTAGARYHF